MEWREEGLLLSVRPHGENAAIIETFSAEKGRYAGVVRGGASRRLAPVLQPGAQLDLSWRARLSEHLGQFQVELIRSRAGEVLGDRTGLAGLSAICALLGFCLPERAAYPALYARSVALLDGLGAEHWAHAYLNWERGLLDQMGYGLDLSRCAVTGQTDDLKYVSPKTGRAVSGSGAGDWADRLLPLTPSLVGGSEDLAGGFRVTGHFLHSHLAASLGDKPLPAARDRLVRLLAD